MSVLRPGEQVLQLMLGGWRKLGVSGGDAGNSSWSSPSWCPISAGQKPGAEQQTISCSRICCLAAVQAVELWLLAVQSALGLGNLHALAGAEPDQVELELELNHHDQHVGR